MNEPVSLPTGWKAEALPGGRARLVCAAANRRVGAAGCLIFPGVIGAFYGGLLLFGMTGAAFPPRPGVIPTLWVVVVASVAAIVLPILNALLTHEEFVAGPGVFEHRRRGPLGSSSEAARGTGVRLRVASRVVNANNARHIPYWMRDLYVESANGGRRITVAFDTHPINGSRTPAQDAADFAEDAAVQIARYLAGVTGWPVEDDAPEALRRHYGLR
jgi:hypothetical protein